MGKTKKIQDLEKIILKHQSESVTSSTAKAPLFRLSIQDWNPEAWPGWLHPHFLSTATSQTYSLPQVLVAQSCPSLCNPMDCSLPGSSDHRIRQARILEWVAISFFRGSSRPRDWTWVSHTVGRFFTIWARRKAPFPSPGSSLTTSHTNLSPRPGTGQAVCCWSQSGWWSLGLRTMLSVITFQRLSAPHRGPRPKRLLSQPSRNSLALHPALSLFITKTVLPLHFISLTLAPHPHLHEECKL